MPRRARSDEDPLVAATDELTWLPAHRIRALYASGDLSPVEVAHHFLARAEAANPRLHAFLAIDPDAVLTDARWAETALFRGEPVGPLHGLPVSVKDTLDTRGLTTTYGSLAFRDHVPAGDAVAVERVRGAGGVVFGKTNTPEFATIGHTTNRLGPQTVNPWDLSRSPAGSSGGAGASVAAGLCPLALGTDAGGSIRYPAAFNGLFGIYPGSGRVPRPGNVEAARGGFLIGGIGPITRDVRDAAILYEVLAGWDPRDPFLTRLPVPSCTRTLDEGVTGLRFGWLAPPPEVFREPVAEAAIRAAAEALAAQGAGLAEIELDLSDLFEIVYPVVAAGQGLLRELAADPATRDLLTPAVLAMAEGPAPTREDEPAAWRARRELLGRVDRAFAGVDVVLSPTTPFPAPLLPTTPLEGFLPYEQYIQVPMLGNITGRPSASVPCGFLDGLPLGLMLTGTRGREDLIFRAARAMEVAQPWADRRPPLFP